MVEENVSGKEQETDCFRKRFTFECIGFCAKSEVMSVVCIIAKLNSVRY